MRYPKKLITDYVNGKISRKVFEVLYSNLQKKDGLNFSCKGVVDNTGNYIVYRGQKAKLKNGVISWVYFNHKKKTDTIYKFRRMVDFQILRETK